MRDVTPPEPEATGAGFLRALIRDEGGSITVERFMQEALYHPRHGYYSRRVRTVGREGDFSTSATLHPALGQAVAAWAIAHRAEVVQRGAWHLIELGGGNGQLAAEVLRSVSWWPRRGLRYHLVEISEGLRATQQARLRRYGRRVQWHADLRSALAAAGGRALIFSNEFVDAFPCVQLVHGPRFGEWQEVRVQWPEGARHPSETVAAWQGAPPDLGSGFAPSVGQRVETYQAYARWLQEGIGNWRAGRLLTIDYGDVPPALYRRKPHGTLRGYCRHQRIIGPEIYQRFGQQDLTADVNFADLQRWGEASGLQTHSLSTQTDFLHRWLPSRVNTDPTLDFLLDPDGAGGAFKVLEQMRS